MAHSAPFGLVRCFGVDNLKSWLGHTAGSNILSGFAAHRSQFFSTGVKQRANFADVL